MSAGTEQMLVIAEELAIDGEPSTGPQTYFVHKDRALVAIIWQNPISERWFANRYELGVLSEYYNDEHLRCICHVIRAWYEVG